MASIGQAAAEGLQSGFGMGMQYDQAQEAKRSRALSEARQAEELGLRKAQLDQQTARQQAQDARQQTIDELQQLKDAHADVVARAEAYSAQGQPVPPELAQEYSGVRARLAEHRAKVVAPKLVAERQGALDFFSGVQAGRIDPLADNVTPAQFYRHVSLATGRTPEDIGQAATAVQQVQEGLKTGNQEMLLRGVNLLAAPDLRAGVGQESPHGGIITRKEVTRLVPVRDANGVEHPDKVFPIIRVYTDKKGPDGQPMYYDAPLTENRSSDPDDPVKAVDLKHAFDYMGNMGTLAAALQDPRAAEKLARGAQEVGKQTQADVDELNLLGRAGAAKHAQAGLTRDLLAIRNDPTLTDEQKQDAINIKLGVKAKAAPEKPPSGGVQSFEARVAAIKALNLPPEAEKLAIKDLTLRGGGKISGDVPVKGATGKGTGMSGGGATGSPPTGKFGSEGDVLQAAEWLVGIDPKTRSGKDRARLSEVRAKLMKASGLTLKDVVQQGENFALTKGAAQEIEKMHAAVESFSLAAQANMKVLEDLSSKLPRSDIPIISKGQLAIESFTGNPVMAQYQGAMQSVATEIARIVTQPRLTGQLTDSARKEIQHFLHGNMTHSQLTALMGTLRTEMKNREAGITAVRDALMAKRTGMADRVEAAATGAPKPAAEGFASEQEVLAAVKAGKVKNGDTVTVNGRKMKWVD